MSADGTDDNKSKQSDPEVSQETGADDAPTTALTHGTTQEDEVQQTAEGAHKNQTKDQAKQASAGPRGKYDMTWRAFAIKTLHAPGYVLKWLVDAVTSRTGLVVIALILIYAFAPIDRVVQGVERLYHDYVDFNPDNEGLIVVDTPQLFTRERLINERLEESAWIEDQLENVNTLLDKDRFAQVDTVSVTKSLLSFLTENGGVEFSENNQDKLGKLADALGATKPTPLQEFRDAKNYRERLSLQRYDSILDDAHDIGSNTLHRMNFRLTLSPARKRSTSVAAVSITVREPRDSRLLFDHYGRLVVETRKKMEETVASLLRDRMLILTRDFQFQTSELEVLDKLLLAKIVDIEAPDGIVGRLAYEEVSSQAILVVDRLVDLVLKQQVDQQEAQAQSYLYTQMNQIGIPALKEKLMPNYPEKRPTYWKRRNGLSRYAVTASRRLIAGCGAPYQLTTLAPDEFALHDRGYLDLRTAYITAQLKIGEALAALEPELTNQNNLTNNNERNDNRGESRIAIQITQAENGSLGTGNSRSQRDRPPESAVKELSNNFDNSLRRPFIYPCPTRENQITLAKLRLLGRLELLERLGQTSLQNCKGKNRKEERERLIAYIGGDSLPEDELTKLRADSASDCSLSELVSKTELLATRVALTGGDYARIGVVLMMKEKLSNLKLDSSSRNMRLGMFFDFDVTRCDLTSCQLHTRSKAETLSENSASTRSLAYRALDSSEKSRHDLSTALFEIEKFAGFGTPHSAALSGPISATANPKLESVLHDSLLDLEERIKEAGREEALRLFLELRCFADARSYTVWPRSGERLASFERDSVQSGARFDFDGTLQRYTGFQASSDANTIKRQETDHIFGIGDWGKPGPFTSDDSASRLKPCNRQLEAVLDQYEPDGTFINEYTTRLRANGLGGEVKDWWESIVAEFENNRTLYCGGNANCEPTLEALMRLAQHTQELELPNTQTMFSWIIAPRRESPRNASRHVPMSLPLSALISLPSWWGHAELEISTCWIRPKDLRERIPTGNLCKSVDEHDAGATRHVLNVPLPGKAQDVLQRIGFFIIRTPYLDTGWHQEEEVEAGRPAKVRLTGSRLWKNPRVRIGNQWHNKIEVLPNMQGVIASFECIHPTLKPGKLTVRLGHEDLPRYGSTDSELDYAETDCDEAAGGTSQGPTMGIYPDSNRCAPKARANEELYVDDRQAEIWTSEGRTAPTVVKVHAFRPRYFHNGEIERPCWLSNSTKTTATVNQKEEIAKEMDEPSSD